KNFIVMSLQLAGERGTTGLFHQPGIYDDPKGGQLRETILPKLRFYSRFINKKQLFPEILATRPFAFSIFGRRAAGPITLTSNILHPTTIDDSFSHDGIGETPGLKDDAGKWDLRPHRSRVVPVDDHALEL